MQRCSTKTKIKTEKSHFASCLAHLYCPLAQQTPTQSTVQGGWLGTFQAIRVETGDVWCCHGDRCQQRLPLVEPLWPHDPHTELE